MHEKKILAITQSHLRWTAALTILSISFSIGVLLAIIIGASSLQWLIIPLVLRGSIVGAWVMGAVIIAASLMGANVRRKSTIQTITNVLLIVCMIQVILILVAGIDVTKTVISPATLAGKFGDAVSNALMNSKRTPSKLRGAHGELFMNMATRVGASIAAVQLIGILPFPYNLVLFLIYYRFITIVIFCILPCILAGIAFYKVYDIRNIASRLEVGDDPQESVREISETSSDDSSDEDRVPLNHKHVVRRNVSNDETLVQHSNRFIDRTLARQDTLQQPSAVRTEHPIPSAGKPIYPPLH